MFQFKMLVRTQGYLPDEGITGTLDYKRDGFMEMMQDATQNKFDMIITKSQSIMKKQKQ